jgi:ribosomal protein S18 acetylase RimI-like enzyme
MDSPFHDASMLAAVWRDPNVVQGEEVLVAEVNGRIVGCATVEDRGRELELVNIDVALQLQGRGIGTMLVRSVEERARAEGKEAVTVGTSRNAQGVAWKSLPWWQHLGYQVTHEEENEWTRSIGPEVREIRLRKDLAAQGDRPEIGVTCGGWRCEHAVVLDYRLRTATAEDARFLADVVCEATRAQGRVPPGFDEREWRANFGDQTMAQIRGEVPGSTTWVIETGTERVGRLRVTRTAKRIELSGVQLLPRVQRHGIGTAIIEDLKAQAAAAGIPLDLEVEKDNPGARRLYERLGFVHAGQTAHEYKLRWNPLTDAVGSPAAP